MNISTIGRRVLRRITSFLAIFAIGITAISFAPNGGWASDKAQDGEALVDRFFIMDTLFWRPMLEPGKQAELLKQAGMQLTTYSGSEWDKLPEVISAFNRENIELIAVYSVIDIDSGELPDYLPGVLKQLSGSETMLWVSPSSKKYGLSDPAGDEAGVAMLQKICDLAQAENLDVSIYPHCNRWCERTDHCARLVKMAGRKNLGMTFNLYHWLKVEGPDNFESKAAAALPYMNCLTINGTRPDAKDVKVEDAIMPLGEGDYDVEAFVKTFIQLGYKGPIGFQGYGIEGDIPAKLKKTIDVWEGYCSKMK